MAQLKNLLVTGVSRFLNKIYASEFVGNLIGNATGIEYIRGTWTAASGTWTGVTKDSELYDGKQIILYMPFAGSGNATLNLTLAGGGTTGAKDVYFENTTRFTTHKGQNSHLHLIYHKAMTLSNGNTYEGWWYMMNRDINDYYGVYNINGTYKTKTALYRYQVLLTIDEEYLLPINAVNNSTATNKTLTTEAFDPFGQIFYYNSTSTYSAGAKLANWNSMWLFSGNSLVDLRYSFNTGNTLTANKAVYLVCAPQSNGLAKLHSAPIAQDLPTSDNGLIYIYLGHAYDNYRITWALKKTLYWYKNGCVREYTNGAAYAVSAGNAATVSGHTVGVNVPSNAEFTDTTYSAATTSANGLMASTDKTKLNNTNVFYGTCATAAGTAAKVVELTNGDNFQLIAGAVIGVKFSYSNTASSVTLNVESKGAKQIWYDNAVYTGTSNHICGYANRINYYMYDGTHWVWMNPGVEFNDNTIPSAYCSTAAGTAAKWAYCTGYMENKDQTIQVIFTNTNTAASELTLNINSRGAHPIWINGQASSSSNYELPAGSYMAYYDHSQNVYHIRTDARLPVDSVTNLTNADFAVESIVREQQSISGGGIKNVSFNIYKPGWCALTICGYNCANGNVFIVTMNPVLGKDFDPATRSFNAGASVTLAFGNKASSTQNFTPQIDVLYMRLKGRQINSNYWGMDGTTIWDGA